LAKTGTKLKFASVQWKSKLQNKTLDLAKVRFCENERVKEWSLHADRVHVTVLNFRPKGKSKRGAPRR
jgi:hypothetical protein